ncbi:hypothetical protein E2C01_052024 [Portunus trituberculatus]|uniref:Uncharacterized protein n=1 Tax=Portunus trituberculatus TaxID=210409 RepID=A0A5B7GGG9_PORTR|nr:hypothetical protein [Portunus trituberculatus]
MGRETVELSLYPKLGYCHVDTPHPPTPPLPTSTLSPLRQPFPPTPHTAVLLPRALPPCRLN